MAKTIAIIGASEARHKFGNKAVRAYRDAGWKVFPVNPHAAEIEGIKAYHRLADIPEPVDRVSVYLPPELSETLLDEIEQAKPEDVYFNPGSATPALIRAARGRGLVAHLSCSIVAIGSRPDAF